MFRTKFPFQWYIMSMFLEKVKFSPTGHGRHYGLCPKMEVPGVRWLRLFLVWLNTICINSAKFHLHSIFVWVKVGFWPNSHILRSELCLSTENHSWKCCWKQAEYRSRQILSLLRMFPETWRIVICVCSFFTMLK